MNSTFRQIGIATSIATLGSIFASALETSIAARLRAFPPLSAHAGAIAGAVKHGGDLRRAVPPASRAAVASAVRASFAGALNDLLVITAAVAFAGAAASFALIRRRDFVDDPAR